MRDSELLTAENERIANMRMAFEVREGNNPRQRDVPNRITGQGDGMLTEGPHENFALDTETLEVEYLKEADWDVETCAPSRAKLDSLGLGNISR